MAPIRFLRGGAVVGVTWSRFHHGHNSNGAVGWRGFVQRVAHSGFPPGILISIVLWCLFSLYWEAAAKNSAEAKSEESWWSRAVHLTLVSAAQLLLLLPVPGLRERFLPNSNWLVVVGVQLEIAFLGLAVWARRLLGSNWSGAIAVKVDQQLIRSGPYRFVRHPIYSGVLGAYASIALISGEMHALLGLILVCGAYWRKIQLEEKTLANVFGSAYENYRTDVRAVIPGVL